MEERAVDGYIEIGTQVRFLADCSEGARVHGRGYILANAKWLAERLERLEMLVSRRLCWKLDQAVAPLTRELEESTERQHLEETRRLTAKEAREISDAAVSLRDTMLAEAAGIVTFVAKEKRYDVTRLLGGVDSLMAPGVFNELPEIAQYDFEQAGKCIAYEVPTAAAFHLMRGTEACLRHFYCSIVKRERVSPLLWFAMTEHLGRRRTPPPKVLMNNLDNLRTGFRNPTQHPDKTYDIDEVQDLFALAVDVVTRMARHLSGDMSGASAPQARS